MSKTMFGMLIGTGILFLSISLQAQTFNVTTPAQFQSALTQAQSNAEDDIINAAAGTYTIIDTLTYASDGNYDLAVSGAGAATTVLDGGNLRQCLTLDNTGEGGLSVSGLTFQNGLATTLGGGLSMTSVEGAITMRNCRILENSSERSAGGAYMGGLNGAITVDSCVIDGNSLDPETGDDAGGLGIYVGINGTADITLQNSTITNNTIGECLTAVGTPDGAGVFMYHLGSGATVTMRNNTISNNTALGGPGGVYFRSTVACTLIFDGNTLSDNASGRSTVGVSGGGVHIELETADFTFSNNKILNNRAIGPWANGGGMDLALGTGGSCEITNNVFAGNTAQQHGGGMLAFVVNGLTRALVAGNLFAGNQAGAVDGSGGGLMLNADCNSTLVNNTFYGNSANDAGGLGYYTENPGQTLTLANDVYQNNTPNALSNVGRGSLTATYSNIQGGSGESWFGAGCIDADPLFFNASDPPGVDNAYATVDDGLHLTASSPSMNTGSNGAVPGNLTTDIAGESRIQDTTVDMGAYEGAADPGLPPCSHCSGSPVILRNVTFDSGTACECKDGTSITIEDDVTVKDGATVIFKAPNIILKDLFRVESGASVKMTQ